MRFSQQMRSPIAVNLAPADRRAAGNRSAKFQMAGDAVAFLAFLGSLIFLMWAR